MATQPNIIPVVTSQVKYAQLLAKLNQTKLDPATKKLIRDMTLITQDALSTVNDRTNQIVMAGAGIANQPTAGVPGRIYFDTQNFVLYVDTGTAWKSVVLS